jgi:iron complex transport system ATP-binding protein
LSKPAITVNNLTIGYDQKVVCENMNFDIRQGELTCLMGKNGAGKSTLLKTVSGLLPAIGGDIRLFGKSMKEYGRNELSKTVAVVLTQRISVDFMTAMEITCMGRYPHTGFMGRLSQHDKKIALSSLEQTGAAELAHRLFSTLSDGEKQKVLIARAIAQEPKVLLLDEPTTHLDIKHKLEIMELLNRLAKEKNISVVLTLHELDLAVKVCQHIIAVKDGKVVYDGTPEAMEKEDTVNRLFDMSPGRFSYVTGSVELPVGSSENIFIVACSGTGVSLYRQFAKRRAGFSTGILVESDCDYPVALSMGANIFAVKPFTEAKEAKEKAMACIDKAKTVIDTGFTIHEQAKGNKELILYALSRNIRIVTFRKKEEFEKEFGKAQVLYIENEVDFDRIFE